MDTRANGDTLLPTDVEAPGLALLVTIAEATTNSDLLWLTAGVMA
jgi:hypothetical protein